MSTDSTRTWIRRTSTAAGLAYTAIAEYELARRLGAQQPIAVMLPVALDCYVIAALKWFRALDVALSLILMCAAQVAAHALDAGVVKVSLELVTVVSVLVPVALWRTHALARDEETTPAPAVEEETLLERVPVPAAVPEGYPTLPEAVPAPPAAVPAGVRLLPLATSCGLPPRAPEPVREVPVPEPAPDHGYPVPEEPEARAWTALPEPDEELEEPDDDPGYPDPLTAQVRADFPQEVPGVRRLRETYRIGQPRAQRIRDELVGVRA
ncbi:hypothetical protein ACFWBR_35115 [Streptomyces sp. NPDC060006]|uniref:hypothetical protein n=1 Tax=unclassified Streptomyces TaxID=2593676 RepID=UPI00368C8699